MFFEESLWPTPPLSPSSSQSSHRSTDDIGAKQHGLRMAEHPFNTLGRDHKTEGVFEHVVHSAKGKEKAIGEIWLDGQTVSLTTWIWF